MTEIIQIFFFVALAYLIIGVVFSIFFYLKGLSRMDETAKESTWGFKLIIFPGIVVFWPILLGKWRKNITKTK